MLGALGIRSQVDPLCGMFVSVLDDAYPWIGIYGKGDEKYYDITTEQPVIFDGQADVEKYPWVTTVDYPQYKDASSVVYVDIDEQARWSDFRNANTAKDHYICENGYRDLIIFF